SGISASLVVDLAAGGGHRWLMDQAEPRCHVDEKVALGDKTADDECEPPPAGPGRARAPAAFPYSFAKQSVVSRAAGAEKLEYKVADYRAEATSPSGRWILLSGEIEEGDFVHRRLLLLDRANGALFPVPGRAGPWPARLAAPGPRPPKLKRPIATRLADGESD